MTKYRIRLVGGRVIGPFVKEQLLELKTKGHISGKEEAQIFPTGSWSTITSFDFWTELTDQDKTIIEKKLVPEDGTFVLDLSKLRRASVENDLDEWVKEEPATIEELSSTKNITSEKSQTILLPTPEKSVKTVENKLELTKELDQDLVLKLEMEPSSRTVTVEDNVPQPTHSLVRAAFELELDHGNEREDKTTINPAAQKELEKMRQRMKEDEEKKKEEIQLKEEESIRRKEDEALALKLAEEEKDESTHILKLDILKNNLIETAKEEEVQIEKVAKEYKKKKAAEEAAMESEEEDDSEEVESEENSKKKRKKLIILLGAVAIGYGVLFPDKGPEKPPFKHIPVVVDFPMPFDKEDSKVAKINQDKGIELFHKGGYTDIIKAGTFFKIAYENNLEDLTSLNYLVRIYAELLRFSKEKAPDSLVLFNIIQSKRPMISTDPNGVIGLNLFYTVIGKHEAATDVIAKYLKLYPKNVTPDLFAVYLRSLIKIGRVDVSKQFFQPLLKVPNKNRYVYEAIIEYLELNQETEKAEEYVDEAIKNNPQKVNFLLMKADILVKRNKLKEVEGFLKRTEALNLEYNDYYRAKFLEIKGLLSAAQGKVAEATKYLTKSLEIEDSNDLRMKLADLSTSGGATAADKLIEESKAMKLLAQAKEFYEKKNYELALSTAARASDAHEGYIPAELFLAKVQLKLGLTEQGIKTIDTLLKKYPDNKDINFAMIDAYIDTYKFDGAKSRIAVVAGMEIKNSWEYASLNAKLYQRMGDSLQAIAWLKASINANPLNDQDIFRLAEMFIKRANFDNARLMLNKCMELDPINADYRIAYSKIIYETQDDQSAIGYLLGLQEEFGENPKFLAEIAIFYFRAGKVKDFMVFKEKLQKLPVKDKALYEFLIRSALLDERYDEIPGLVESLIQIEPGDLESMMTAGRVLFENGKLKEAALWFKRVQDKLSTYPKVQYYIARIKLLAGEIEDPLDAQGKPTYYDKEKTKPILGAKNLINKDIKENGKNDISLVLLAEIYVKEDDLVKAEGLYKEAQKINPRSYEALVGMADISTKRNNFDLALDLYQRAINLKSEEAILHKKVGDVYRLLGQGALAIESYKLYLLMNPDASDKAQLESYINLMQ
jgi:tetratricopeptide (TPR) repeat protein